MRIGRYTGAIAGFCLLVAAGPVAGEVIVLRGGGRVVGSVVQDQDLPRGRLRVETPLGPVTLDRSEVRQTRRESPVEDEYEQIRPDYPDTAEGQWALAEWCRQKRLREQRERHLMRVVELDPDHEAARQALGYRLDGGRWVTEQELMEERGYRRYRGSWLMPQEIELLERRHSRERAESEWFGQVTRWRNQLDGDRGREARQALASIDDPLAVKALARALADEPRPPVRLLLLESLAKIGSPDALEAVAASAIEDPVEDIRLTAIAHLTENPHPAITNYFLSRLRARDNRTIQRAAAVLERLDDPSAIPGLIAALVTTHSHLVNPNPGQTSASFGSGGGISFGMGGGPQRVSRRVQNDAVLQALVSLSGMNFGFDQRGWQTWYASSQHREATIDLRRN